MAWSKLSRHERGYGTAWDKLRLTILARDSYLCQPCLTKGRPTPATQVDHIIAKAQGGTDDADNLQAICTDCHKDKTADESGHATHPTWFEPSAIPLTILCGPPCSGKTTYMTQHAKRGDVTIDLDIIRSSLEPSYRQWTKAIDDVLMNKSIRLRNAMLGELHRSRARAAWFIVSAPAKAERQWWAKTLNGEIVLLDPGVAECKRRAIARGTPLALNGVDSWHWKSSRPWAQPKRKVMIGPDGWPSDGD